VGINDWRRNGKLRLGQVVDVLRERKPPFSPEHVVGEFATLLKSYGVSQISGDRFANVWPVEVFAKVGKA
jgi:hypothetical protein